jgi:hypothetical protein
MTSNHGRLKRDGIFGSLQIGTNMSIDRDGNAKLNDMTVRGNVKLQGGVAGLWRTEKLVDEDQESWAPVDHTRYFQTEMTSDRTLTLSQESLNTAYPDAGNCSVIEFDFIHSTEAHLCLEVEDLDGVYLNNSISPPRTFDEIVHMKGGYVTKEAGAWYLVMPDLRYD